jgi:hypothetical protein
VFLQLKSIIRYNPALRVPPAIHHHPHDSSRSTQSSRSTDPTPSYRPPIADSVPSQPNPVSSFLSASELSSLHNQVHQPFRFLSPDTSAESYKFSSSIARAWSNSFLETTLPPLFFPYNCQGSAGDSDHSASPSRSLLGEEEPFDYLAHLQPSTQFLF